MSDHRVNIPLMALRRLFGAMVLFLSVVVSAAPYSANLGGGLKNRVWRGWDAAQVAHLWVLHSEEAEFGHPWVLDEIRVRPGKLQELVSSHRYSSESSAVARIQYLRGLLKGLRPIEKSELPLFQVATEVPGENLWSVTQVWNSDWEKKYAEWITQNLNKDFFKNHGFATDCADVAYALRWIFARDHGLPAGNMLSGTRNLFTQDSVREEWVQLPKSQNWFEDRRFLAALEYVLEHTYTHTLVEDSYPIKITPESFMAGLHILNLHDTSGHTRMLQKIDLKGDRVLTLMSSTVPRAVRSLYLTDFWQEDQWKEKDGGFLRFRWPEKFVAEKTERWILKSPSSMADYSKEQFDPAFVPEGYSFDEAVLVRLSPDLDFLARLKSGIETLRGLIASREEIVQQGYEFCSTHKCREGSKNYEDWSTPSRDKQLEDHIQQLRASVVKLSKGTKFRGVVGVWRDALRQSGGVVLGKDVTLGAVIGAVERKMIQSDPRLTPALRWGLDPQVVAVALWQQIQDKLTEREEDLGAGSAVRGIDSTLVRLAKSRFQFCRFAGPGECDVFDQTLADVTGSWGGVTASAREWMERLEFLNADAGATREESWGGASRNYVAARFSFDQTADVSSQGWARIIGIEDHALVNLVTQDFIELPSMGGDFLWVEKFSHSGLFATATEDTTEAKCQFTFYDPAAAWSWNRTVTNSYGCRGNWLGDAIYSYGTTENSAFKTEILDLRSQAQPVVHAISAAHVTNFAPGLVFMGRNLKTAQIWSFREPGKVVKRPLVSTDEGTSLSIDPGIESETHYWMPIERCLASEDRCRRELLAVDKKTGATALASFPVPHHAGYSAPQVVAFSANAKYVARVSYGISGAQRETKLIEVFSLDTVNLKVEKLEVEFTGGFKSFSEDSGPYLSLHDMADKTKIRYFRLTNEGLQEDVALAGEGEILSMSGGLVTRNLADGNKGVRLFGQSAFSWQAADVKTSNARWVAASSGPGVYTVVDSANEGRPVLAYSWSSPAMSDDAPVRGQSLTDDGFYTDSKRLVIQPFEH